MSKLTAHESGSTFQTNLRLRRQGSIAHQGKINFCMGIILRNLDISQGHQPNPRIFQFHLYDFRKFTLDLLGYTPGSGEIFWHNNLAGLKTKKYGLLTRIS
jgi:hypothetical protein